MEYLPDDHYTDIASDASTDTNYKAYGNAVNASGTLCPIWSNHFLRTQIKVIVLGEKGIGKTSLIKRFIDQTYTENDHPTTDQYNTQINTKAQQCSTAICDFSNTYTFEILRDDLLRSGQIFLCCFSVDSKTSYKTALEDTQRIYRCKDGFNDYAVILVATKCDLKDNTDRYHDTTLVNTERITEQTKKLNMSYIETSAKHNVNIDFLFERSIYEYWVQSESHKCPELI